MNENSIDDKSVPHFSAFNPEWRPLPAYGGSEAVLYRSADGRRVVGTFKESGKYTYEYQSDEFVYVVAGTGIANVRGGPTVHLKPGDMAYFRDGLVVDFEMSDDFQDVAMHVGDDPVEY